MAKLATFYDHIAEIARQENISVTEAMQEAKALGVELLEVAQNNLDGRVEEVSRELTAAGLGVSSVPAWFSFESWEETAPHGRRMLEAACAVGAEKLLVIPAFFSPEDGERERTARRERIAEGIARLGELAREYGVSLIMEEFDNALSPICRVEDVKYFLDRCPDLSAAFDTGNFRFAAQDEHEAYEVLRGRIAHVHLKDRAYSPAYGQWAVTAADGKQLYPCPVGAGDLDIQGLLRRLKADGYDGVYSVEHYGAPAMLEFLKRSVAWVKERI